jgi:exonuclease III
MVNLLQWNVRSLPARLPSIQNFISSYKCSIILISETWLLPSRNCFIPHFNLFRQDRTDGYGGVAIAVHTSLNVSLIEINPFLKQLLLENNIDLIGIKVYQTHLSGPVTVQMTPLFPLKFGFLSSNLLSTTLFLQ